ncbi:BACON domain-containing protein [Sphingobacterium arenae]|uniref:BACON domain-containing protein n=1 Tax=Sphingobacterium arenae TaxID=1280598 RepID=A0ABR7Y148_9SPHI|nr:BACON domain-containing protein [Sphingobacterium arenae]MBD1425029.1 BACON domain-containing protein [Sphingobacterium arenae]
MKNIKATVILLTILATMSFHSCKQTLDMDDIFEVSTNSVSLNYQGLLENGDHAQIEIGTSGTWQVSSKPEWIELSKGTGDRGRYTIFLTGEEAGTMEDREGKIVFESLGQTISVDIKQVKKVEELNISPAEIAVNIRGLLDNGKAPAIYISTNSDWRISELPEWISVDKTEGKAGNVSVILTVTKNNTGESRQGSFTVISGDKTEKVDVEQDLTYIPLTEVTIITGNQSGAITSGAATFEINAVEAWTLASDSWIHVTPNKGDAGTTEVTVSLEPTAVARTGAITIKDADNLTTVVTVKQEVLLPDDGKAVGYLYYADDFEWVRPYGGEDELLKAPTSAGHGKGFAGSTKNMHTTGPTGSATVSAATAFANRNYEDVNWNGNAFYYGAHYFKMGKTDVETGIKLVSIPNTTADRSTNVRLTFNATPARGGSSGSGFDDVILMVEIEGPGSVGIDDKSTKYKDDLDIQIPDNAATDWYWIEKSVVLYGITSETKVIIRPSTKTLGGRYNRWLLNDIKLEKHSKVN